jgi:Anp1
VESLPRPEIICCPGCVAAATLSKVYGHVEYVVVMQALEDEDYVLWIDVDLRLWPDNIIETLIGTGKDIVVPNCVMELGGRSYDLNTWKRGNRTNE